MARPLTRTQEVLFISTAFVFGGVLQVCVVLHIFGILESGLSRFIGIIVSR